MKKYLGSLGFHLGSAVERVAGPIKIGADPFANDPFLFYDVIQRRRNWANASFCCGAGSIHRREAVMQVAVKTFADSIDGYIRKFTDEIDDPEIKNDLAESMRKELFMETELTPYKFHVSEDIYTSILIHSDPDHNWKSVYHPYAESKLLSPQDLLSWTVQRFKYAAGTLDIFRHDSPLFKKGMSLPQKIMYGATFWSYLSCIWNIIFLVSPIIYLFIGIAPVATYAGDFFIHFLPFILAMYTAYMLGTWGVSSWRGSTFYLSFFPINFKAIYTVLKGEKITFKVTPKQQQHGNFIGLVVPQIIIAALTAIAIVFAIVKFFVLDSVNLGGIIANVYWGIINIFAMLGIISAAFKKSEENL